MNKEEYKKMYLQENKHFWFVAKRYFIDAYLEHISKRSKKILDIGCGTGGLTSHLKKYGDVIGIDKSPAAINFSKTRKLKVLKGTAENLPFDDAVFDIVTLFDVLYHKNVRSVDKSISEASRILKPSGYILITDSALNLIRSGHDSDLGGERRFTITKIIKVLKDNGFEPIKYSYIYFTIFPVVLIKRLIVNKLIKSQDISDVKNISKLLNNILLILLKTESKLIKYVSLPWGSSLIVLAQKQKYY